MSHTELNDALVAFSAMEVRLDYAMQSVTPSSVTRKR